MSIQEDRDAKFITFLQYFPESLYVCVVVDSSLRLYSLPCCMESNGIHAPVLEIIQILISKTVIAGEFHQVRVEGMGFVYSIDSVKHSISIVLVNKERIVRIYPDCLCQRYENCKDKHCTKYLHLFLVYNLLQKCWEKVVHFNTHELSVKINLES